MTRRVAFVAFLATATITVALSVVPLLIAGQPVLAA